MDVQALIDAVVAIQKANGWSDAQMAKQLRMSRQGYAFIRRGEKRPGPRFFVGVRDGIPELREAARECFFTLPATPVQRVVPTGTEVAV